MKRDDTIELLSEHRESLECFEVESLAIFGSVARGESEERSDLDVLVEFKGKATFDSYMDQVLPGGTAWV